ncbi:hypothetical protein R1sor_005912 [Riccia sorocarpa]|uniref:Uncharacterized protein n=1 Tax=Riccia sorocarpa TaxID=122646 RepID=A0ABD3HQ45_9MARC
MAAPRSLSEIKELIAGGMPFPKTRLAMTVAQFSSNEQLNYVYRACAFRRGKNDERMCWKSVEWLQGYSSMRHLSLDADHVCGEHVWEWACFFHIKFRDGSVTDVPLMQLPKFTIFQAGSDFFEISATEFSGWSGAETSSFLDKEVKKSRVTERCASKPGRKISLEMRRIAVDNKSNVGLFVKDEDLLDHLHDFSEFVGGRKVAMRETLKSGKIKVGVDVKDEAMLGAMPFAAKIWLDEKKSMGKGYRREFSKTFVKLLYAHVHLPNPVCFKNKGLDPFRGRWSSHTSNLEAAETSTRKR